MHKGKHFLRLEHEIDRRPGAPAAGVSRARSSRREEHHRRRRG